MSITWVVNQVLNSRYKYKYLHTKKPLFHTWVVFCVASSKSSVQVTRFPSVSFQPSVALQTPPWRVIMVMMTVMISITINKIPIIIIIAALHAKHGGWLWCYQPGNMIAMSRCGAICLMVGGPTPLGRGRTDAPGKRIEYIELIWSKDEGNTCDGRRPPNCFLLRGVDLVLYLAPAQSTHHCPHLNFENISRWWRWWLMMMMRKIRIILVIVSNLGVCQ